jgi:uncharacterized protein YfaS (alpha-2-macroglobulin family)
MGIFMPPERTNMKHFRLSLLLLLLLVAGFANAQTKNWYDRQWDNVDTLLHVKGLPKSALTVANAIYDSARKQGNEPQLIRAIYYRGVLRSQSREDNSQIRIQELEAEARGLIGVAASIAHAVIAQQYVNYLQAHNWQIRQRTDMPTDTSRDITTWSRQRLVQKIDSEFDRALQPAGLLQQTRTENWSPLIVKGNTPGIRPTLYDLIAHMAIAYYSSGQANLGNASEENSTTMPAAFAPAPVFIQAHVDTAKMPINKALLLYQELTRLHSRLRSNAAFETIDIERIQFAYSNYTGQDKDSLYVQGLRARINAEKQGTIAAGSRFLLATWYRDRANGYDAKKDTAWRFGNIKALELLKPILSDSAQSPNYWAISFNLQQDIRQPLVSMQVEKVNLPGAPFRFLLKWKNQQQVYLRVIPMGDSLDYNFSDKNDWTRFFAKTAVKSWRQELPATNDMQEHSVELKADVLPVGRYMLVASTTEQFSSEVTFVTGSCFHVSSIAYLFNQRDAYVVDRASGRPVAGAKIRLFELTNRNSDYKLIRTLVGNYVTDARGRAQLDFAENDYHSYQLDVKHGNDQLFLSDDQDVVYNPNAGWHTATTRTERPDVYFFTDRALYRPGQTLYVKGIVVNQNKEPILLTKTKTRIVLRDPNGKEQAGQDVETNEFGSFQLKFTLPSSGLTGQFSLAAQSWNGWQPISVEEYKRPKFEVKFDTLRQAYRVYDTVTSSGKAIAYAGNSLSGAQVRYRVVRNARFPYYYYWLRMPSLSPAEIAHGTTTTDDNGNFNIRFPALPDRSLDSANNPTFSYQVTVDVTDINGETHSSSQSAQAGYHSLYLATEIPATIIADSFRSVQVRLTNANGQTQQGRVTAKFFAVQPERRLLRNRFWEAPDMFVMSRDSFVRWFPHDPYTDEGDMQNWPLAGEKLQWSDTLVNNALRIPAGQNLQAGIYELQLSVTDKDGQLVKDRRRFELNNPGQLTIPTYLSSDMSQQSAEPGETVTSTLRSSTDLYLFQLLQRRKSKYEVDRSVIAHDLRNGALVLQQPVKESDRGGINSQYYTVKDNRFFTAALGIDVPWTNKQLQVSIATFRDKALPGSTEQWRVQIKGSKGEQFAAEMLASMYDASLDQIKPHNWNQPRLWTGTPFRQGFGVDRGFIATASEGYMPDLVTKEVRDQRFDQFLFDRLQYYGDASFVYRWDSPELNEVVVTALGTRKKSAEVGYSVGQALAGKVSGLQIQNVSPDSVSLRGSKDGSADDKSDDARPPASVSPRRNFNETAFFYPQLRTDSAGGISFSFTLPEALTRWKFQALAHTKELAFGYASKEIVTQKDLMVQPNIPRFLRQGDHLELTTKIVNLSNKELTGQAQLELFDAATGTPVDGWFSNFFPNQYFTVAPGGSELVAFPMEVPYLYNSALTWRITARSGDFSDAEENTLPILSSKILVTETMPLPMRGSGTKTFRFEKLLQSGSSESLQHKGLTIEYTANPAWYAVQALPYLMEYPYECAEQTWNRYYANALAAHIINKAPRIKAIFERWQTIDTAALLSNLEKNQELKSALLEETPWVMQAQNETQQKKNIALLFDLTKLAAGQQRALEKLQRMQLGDGSFPWFDGGRGDRYITLYIISGIGHLQELGVPVGALTTLRDKALFYADAQLRRDYDELKKSKADLKKQSPDYIQLLHLYARSFTRNRPGDANRAAFDYYLERLAKTWVPQSKRAQGMIALALYRYNTKTVPVEILASLRETAVRNDELGMYWKDMQFGRSWYWYDAPIETQALLIEAFAEIGKDTTIVNDMRTWLVKNKQTNGWRTTIATADACYALLLRGSDWLSTTPRVILTAGPVAVSSDTASEAGTGYFKKYVDGPMVRPSMGEIKVTIQTDSNGKAWTAPSWGAVYWQYFEEMDKVTSASTNLQLERKLFKEVNTDKGPKLEPIENPGNIKVGDKIRVRLVLRCDRPMQYVHLKDLRASCLEPVNVLSGYRWQDALGYYESTRDLSTNFFIDYLPRGTFVFEYPLFVTHKGQFSAGIATIQCMYAPEFSAHSEGQKVTVE